MNYILILGNIIALIASILMVYSGFVKQKKKILFVQTSYIGLFTISEAVLGGISGVITNILGCIRNILCYKNKLGTKSKIILIILSIILTLYFNNLGIIGLFPLFSAISYILFMNVKDIIKFKYLTIFTLVMWLIYDLIIQSYTSALFYFITIFTNIFSIYKIKASSKES